MFGGERNEMTHFLDLLADPLDTERETGRYDRRVATGGAITGNGDNDTPVQSQPHAMRAVT